MIFEKQFCDQSKLMLIFSLTLYIGNQMSYFLELQSIRSEGVFRIFCSIDLVSTQPCWILYTLVGPVFTNINISNTRCIKQIWNVKCTLCSAKYSKYCWQRFYPNVRRLLAGWLRIHYNRHHIFESIQVHISWHLT